METRMKGGIVTSIRLNPKDCQSVLDVLEKAGVRTTGMSFASMTALALSSLMEAARQDSVIPEPDPFQYLNRLQPYIKSKHGRKLQITQVLHNAGATLHAPPVSASVPEAWPEAAEAQVLPVTDAPPAVKLSEPVTAPAVATEVNEEELRFATNRLTELLHKKDAVDAGVAGMHWSEYDTDEYRRVFAIVYPDG